MNHNLLSLEDQVAVLYFACQLAHPSGRRGTQGVVLAELAPMPAVPDLAARVGRIAQWTYTARAGSTAPPELAVLAVRAMSALSPSPRAQAALRLYQPTPAATAVALRAAICAPTMGVSRLTQLLTDSIRPTTNPQ